MYTIRTCKECGQKLNIRQNGKLLEIRNTCIHIPDEPISIDRLDKLTVPLRLIPDLPNITVKPYLCVKHDTPLEFRKQLRQFTDLYYCSECNKIDKNIPRRYIKWWKNKTWNDNWRPGEVKLTISPSYKELMGSGQL